MTIRRSQAQMTVAAGVGGDVLFPLPSIERLLIVPQIIQFTSNLQYVGNDWMGLTHQRDSSAPTGASLGNWNDPNIWVQINANSITPVTVRLDLRGLDFDLAGPQRFLAFNNEAGNLSLSCTMWYETKRTSQGLWNQILRSTSFEE